MLLDIISPYWRTVWIRQVCNIRLASILCVLSIRPLSQAVYSCSDIKSKLKNHRNNMKWQSHRNLMHNKFHVVSKVRPKQLRSYRFKVSDGTLGTKITSLAALLECHNKCSLGRVFAVLWLMCTFDI